MNSEEFDRKVFLRIKRLQASRRQYSVSVHELQEIGRKLTILGSLLSLSPKEVWMSSDRESVLFSDKKGGEELGISRAELDALPHQIAHTLLASREIEQLEQCLIDAGFGDIIKKAD